MSVSKNSNKTPSILHCVFVAVMDFIKVIGAIILIFFLIYSVSRELSWESTPVGIHTFSRSETEITVHAPACDDVRFSVRETGDEIRVSAKWRSDNIVDDSFCTYSTEVIELDEPVGSRQIVDADTGETLRCVAEFACVDLRPDG